MVRRPRREVRGERFDGARELDCLLRERNQSVPSFCDEHGLDRFHVQRLLGGQVKRCPPVDIVLAIEAATDGRVKPSTWTEDTLRADDDSGPDVDSDASKSGENEVLVDDRANRPTGS